MTMASIFASAGNWSRLVIRVIGGSQQLRLGWISLSERNDVMAGVSEARNKPAADETGCPGDQNRLPSR